MSERYMLEPVGWQFYQDGKWWNGDDQIKDHRKNTEEASYPIRDVYAVEQQSAIGAGGVALRKARVTSSETKISALMSKISTLVDKRLSCEPCAEAEEDLLQFLRTRYAATHSTQQGLDAAEWEEIYTLPTCDDLIWLYCQDTNTVDGPIAPEPSLEQYGWTHWAYANAPSTAWIDAAQAKKEGEKE